MVRIEAYKILARNKRPLRLHQLDRPGERPGRTRSSPWTWWTATAPPIIYASRQGKPRIAVIGKMPDVRLPVMFSALDNRLTISSYGNERYAHASSTATRSAPTR